MELLKQCILALAMAMTVIQVGGAKDTTSIHGNWPKSIIANENEVNTVAFIGLKGQPTTLMEGMKDFGIEATTATQLMKKEHNNYYYAIMGAGTMMPYGWEEEPIVDSSSSLVSVPMEGTLYSQPLGSLAVTLGTVTKETRTEGMMNHSMNLGVVQGNDSISSNSASVAPISMPVVAPPRPKMTVSEYIQKLSAGTENFRTVKPFVKDKKGVYEGAIEYTTWYRQVPYKETMYIKVGEQKYGAPMVKFMIVRSTDVDLFADVKGKL